jgi:hypothetical protein
MLLSLRLLIDKNLNETSEFLLEQLMLSKTIDLWLKDGCGVESGLWEANFPVKLNIGDRPRPALRII